MTVRTITLTLTEPQFKALAGAVDAYAEEYRTREAFGGLDQSVLGKWRALDNAWGKIRDAWYARERRRG